MREKLSSITRRFRLPTNCSLCNQYHQGSLAVCSYCIQLITPTIYRCKSCARTLPQSDFLLCGQCIKQPPSIDNCYINYAFEEPLRSLLHRFKYQNELQLTPVLGQLMLNALSRTDAQCLIPIPLHPKRLKERGFNQAAILAKWLSKQIHIPYHVNLCNKIINTPPQATLDGVERQKNLRHAFLAKPTDLNHVILIDDLLTTGATANELAKTLKLQGVKQVDVWCCARA